MYKGKIKNTRSSLLVLPKFKSFLSNKIQSYVVYLLKKKILGEPTVYALTINITNGKWMGGD